MKISATLPPTTRLLDPDALAKRLGVSLSTIDRLVRAGEIPFIEIGSLKRFDFAEVVSVLRTKTRTKAP